MNLLCNFCFKFWSKKRNRHSTIFRRFPIFKSDFFKVKLEVDYIEKKLIKFIRIRNFREKFKQNPNWVSLMYHNKGRSSQNNIEINAMKSLKNLRNSHDGAYVIRCERKWDKRLIKVLEEYLPLSFTSLKFEMMTDQIPKISYYFRSLKKAAMSSKTGLNVGSWEISPRQLKQYTNLNGKKEAPLILEGLKIDAIQTLQLENALRGCNLRKIYIKDRHGRELSNWETLKEQEYLLIAFFQADSFKSLKKVKIYGLPSFVQKEFKNLLLNFGLINVNFVSP